LFNPRRNHRAALDTAEYGGITACSARTSHGEPTTGKLRVFGAFGTALSPLVGGQLGVTTSPNPVVPEFPHLAPTGHEDIPALADLFGLREHAPQQPTS
jgi:hypothetical protein